MNYIDFIYIALFAVLFKNKHTRLASSVFVFCYILFLVMHNLLPNGYTYVSSGTAHLIIFLSLIKSASKTYFLVSILSVCLILVNIQGYINYENYLPPDKYNDAYTVLLNAQLFLLYLRAGINGLIDRFNFKRDLVQFIADSNFEAIDKFIQSEKEAAKK